MQPDHHPAGTAPDLGGLERRLLNDYQRDFPLLARPYGAIAEAQEAEEAQVIEVFKGFAEAGLISRIGAVVRPHRAGWSTLAAMAVPEARLEAVAALVSAYPEVNHNYEREHGLNLWFVATGRDEAQVTAVLAEIERRSGIEVLNLPLEEAFCLDLGFPIQW